MPRFVTIHREPGLSRDELESNGAPVLESTHAHFEQMWVWFCDGCGSEIAREEWDTSDRLSQEAYRDACQDFNASLERRTCPGCGHVHPEVDLSGIRWQQIAAQLRGAKPAAASA